MAKIKTRARTLDMLGRQQIAGIPTALSELFKNAHDAYAENVEVDYIRKQNLLILRDDGLGMSRDEFESRWLTIGTDSKYEHYSSIDMPSTDFNKKKRVVMGEKGIGRLAIAAIGPQVIVLTRKKNYLLDENGEMIPLIKDLKEGEKQEYKFELSDLTIALVNWSLFELPGLDLDDIEIPMETIEGGKYLTTDVFTRLLSDTKKNYKVIAQAKIEQFKRTKEYEKLQGIISPSELLEEIKIILGLKKIEDELLSFSNINPDIVKMIKEGPSLFDNGHGTHFIISSVEETLIDDIEDYGKNKKEGASKLEKGLLGFTNTMNPNERPPIIAKFRYHTLDNFRDELIGEDVFFTPDEFQMADHHIEGEFNEYGQFVGKVSIYGEEEKEYVLPWLDGKGNKTLCGKFSFKLAYVQGSLKDTKLPHDIWKDITAKTDKIGGLYVYRDGIRILPYGDVDYDFLHIEKRRTKRYSSFFSYRRMMGYVELSREKNNTLQEKAGREGFIENTAYRQFKKILENLFIQLAQDVFNDGGDYSDLFIQKRDRLNKDYENLKKRNSSVSKKREQLSKNLDKFFLKSHELYWKNEVERIKCNTLSRLGKITSDDIDNVDDLIYKIEKDVRSEFARLDDELIISRPSGVGLTKTLSDDWDQYLTYKKSVSENVIKPVKKELSSVLMSIENTHYSSEQIKDRMVKSVESLIDYHDRQIKKRTSVLGETLSDIQGWIKKDISKSREEAKTNFNNSLSSLISLDASSRDPEYLAGVKIKVEESIEDVSKNTVDGIDELIAQLNTTKINTDENVMSSNALLASLETQLEILKEEVDNNTELAQLGMSIGVIHHEFSSHIRNVRAGIRELQPLVIKSKKATIALNRIRVSFEHLDGYLKLFTPLSRRLNRKKVKVTGASIYDFIFELFSERIEEQDIELIIEDGFKTSYIETYTSTILPAFVNIVDNAIYWASRIETGRYIKFGFSDGGFYITDSGPGVALKDRDVIFEFGFSRKYQGRGMGLYITKQTLDQEDLDLTLAHYKATEGATFIIAPKSESKVS
ncbi:ATP-binding protein [Photobacterium sp.]|uniref:ATP-binding protein n=1 Tax=Photobacterium sp. TaxID=660 RepID=UPI00299ED1EE|nr:ATP-binding protein [Photobacterium sp.]MDX1300927.1 ATP-binding protein [Photobacterium sp.]